MATDGVKIIDGDTAHGIYSHIMDLYDGGATPDAIMAAFPFPPHGGLDAFDYEIGVTAYALALWEIGGIRNEIVAEVERVMQEEACVKRWTESYGEKAGRMRQRELDKLWKKITAPNPRIRRRRTYKVITDFIFQLNDVLAFECDGWYFACLVLDIEQYRGECSYRLGKLTYRSKQVPTMDEIRQSDIVGRKIPSGAGMNMEILLSMGMDEIIQQGGVDQILRAEAERTGSYYIGMSMTGVMHKDMKDMAEHFTRIGNLPLQETCRNLGTLGGASNMDDFSREFVHLHSHIRAFGEETFPLKNFIL